MNTDETLNKESMNTGTKSLDSKNSLVGGDELSGKYTLLYSMHSTRLRDPCRARTNDGRVVEYTCMVEESEFGPWKDNYKWDDAKVVGYIDSYSQITFVSPVEIRW